MGGSRSQSDFVCFENRPKNSYKPVLIFWTLLKVVSYDLSVLSISVMGFQKKFGWVGWVG